MQMDNPFGHRQQTLNGKLEMNTTTYNIILNTAKRWMTIILTIIQISTANPRLRPPNTFSGIVKLENCIGIHSILLLRLKLDQKIKSLINRKENYIGKTRIQSTLNIFHSIWKISQSPIIQNKTSSIGNPDRILKIRMERIPNGLIRIPRISMKEDSCGQQIHHWNGFPRKLIGCILMEKIPKIIFAMTKYYSTHANLYSSIGSLMNHSLILSIYQQQ